MPLIQQRFAGIGMVLGALLLITSPPPVPIQASTAQGDGAGPLAFESSSLRSSTSIFSEDFEDPDTYEDWSIEIQEGPVGWDFGSPRDPEGAIDGTYAYIDSDAAGSAAGRIVTTLSSPEIDLSPFPELVGNVLILEFGHMYRALGSQIGAVDVRRNQGAWENIATYTTTKGEIPADGVADGVAERLLLTGFGPDDTIQFRFRFDDNGTWGWYWLVDNIHLYFTEPQPELSLEPGALDFGSTLIGETKTITVVVSNEGTARLEADIETPEGIEASISSLSLVVGNQRSIDFTFQAQTPGDYDEVVEFLTNQADDEIVEMPAQARVGDIPDELFEDFDDWEPETIPDFWSARHFGVVSDRGTDESNAFRSNLWLFQTSSEFTTRPVDLPAVSDQLIAAFDYRITNWVFSGPPITPAPASSITIDVLVERADGTREILGTIDEQNHVESLDYRRVYWDLNEYAGERIRLHLQADYISGDTNLDIDNVRIGTVADPFETEPAIQPEVVDFGPTFPGQTLSRELVILNSALRNATVGDIDIANGFTTDLTPGTVIPLDQQLAFSVSLSADAVDDYSGEISIELIYPEENRQLTADLAGQVVEPPVKVLNPETLENTVQIDADGVQMPGENNLVFRIENQGDGAMFYSIPDFAVAGVLGDAENLRNITSSATDEPPPEKGEEDLRQGHPVILGAGGPDDFGYQWIDSNEAGGPIFNWIDARDSGEELTGLAGSEDGNTRFQLPFSFPFYGNDHDEVTVSVNGFLTFSDFTGWGFQNLEIPDATAPNALVAVFWDDLTLEQQGGVYVDSSDERVIIQWDEVARRNTDGSSYTFQVVLYPDGTLVKQYLDTNGPVDTATLGIEDELGETGLQVAFNTEYVTDGLALVILPDRPRLISDVQPDQGGVSPGGSNEATVFIDATGVEAGEYSDRVAVLSNDPETPRADIDVNITVIGTPRLDVRDSLESSGSLASLPFGTLYLGDALTKSVYVINTGTGDFLFDKEITGQAFSVTSDLADDEFKLGPGEHAVLEITFEPDTAPAEFEGSLAISTDHDEGHVVTLSGESLEGPVADVDPGELLFEGDRDEVIEKTLTLSNLGRADLHYSVRFEGPDDPEIDLTVSPMDGTAQLLADEDSVLARSDSSDDLDLLWDNTNPDLSQDGFVSTIFLGEDAPVYSAANFSLFADSSIEQMFFPGFNSQGGTLNPTDNPGVHFYIYEDDDGVPAGHPEDDSASHIWTFSTTLDGLGVSVNDNNVTVNIVDATGEAVDLDPASYWVAMAIEADTDDLGAASRWNWKRGNPVGGVSQFIDITDVFGAGFTEWTSVDETASNVTHVGLRIEGEINSPLSVSPLRGVVESGPENAQELDVRFSSDVAGTFNLVINIETNDPENPVISIPVTAVVEAPDTTDARLQIIHNAADPATELVDVYVNGDLLIDELEFRSATPYFSVPSNVDKEIAVSLAGDGYSNAFYTALKSFEPGEAYTIIANGVEGSGFLSNPDGESIGFGLYVLPEAREAALDIETVDLRIFHGVTDAPSMDVAFDGQVVAGGLGYGGFSDYLTVDPSTYEVDVLAAGADDVLYSFLMDLSDDDAFAATAVASGFVNSNANNRGENFALMLVFENGLVVMLDERDVDDPTEMALKKELDGDPLYVEVGEELAYSVTVQNTGQGTLTDVLIEDAMISPSSRQCDSVAPGESCVLQGLYTVTESDGEAGVLINQASAEADGVDEMTVEHLIPVGEEIFQDGFSRD